MPESQEGQKLQEEDRYYDILWSKYDPPDPYSPALNVNILRLEITELAYKKIMAYCRDARGEISGFAKTRIIEGRQRLFRHNGALYPVKEEPRVELIDALIFKQVCTDAHTSISAESLARFYVELARRGEKPEEWNCWWHSHVEMSAFFSSVDTATISKLSAGSKLFSLCVNKFGDMTARLDQDSDLITWLKPVVIVDDESEISKQCRDEIKEKVKYQKLNYKKYWGKNGTSKAARFDKHGKDNAGDDNDGRGWGGRKLLSSDAGEDGGDYHPII